MGKKSAEEKARRDAVKRYLQQYHAAKREMGILEERRRTLSTELRGPSVSDPWRPAPAARHDRSDGAGAAVLQIADVEDRIERQRRRSRQTAVGRTVDAPCGPHDARKLFERKRLRSVFTP